MADQPQDQKASKKGSEKQQPETVVLTSDELRAIAGGGSVPTSPTGTSPGSPNPTPKGMVGGTMSGQ